MTWTMYYGDKAVFRRLTLDQMDVICRQVDVAVAGGHGWFDLQSPHGDGITFQRFHVSANSPIMFDPS